MPSFAVIANCCSDKGFSERSIKQVNYIHPHRDTYVWSGCACTFLSRCVTGRGREVIQNTFLITSFIPTYILIKLSKVCYTKMVPLFQVC